METLQIDIEDLWQAFNLASGISSIIGLLLSIWVLYGVTKLRKSFKIKAELPRLLANLKKIQNDFSQINAENTTRLIEQASLFHTSLETIILQDLDRKTKGRLANNNQSISTLLKVKHFPTDGKTRIYILMVQSIGIINDYQNLKLKWSEQ
ncbi:hypothetical protein [Acanthopleuribacter pedis]|uniref:Uncharacterized protein n=1 Tax=Acanthopleuribacter pedis TaxID=442870 RepID=A0A8J7Q5N7_9BACT|nr:hypothetical protein [Acanthopleuribacter pedis]MBO1317290.1 hypothetical protein [Acanthopleuribacter pedis]MBO1318597.1 hypothetical protein [Acanthopleuribacter pedis]